MIALHEGIYVLRCYKLYCLVKISSSNILFKKFLCLMAALIILLRSYKIPWQMETIRKILNIRTLYCKGNQFILISPNLS